MTQTIKLMMLSGVRETGKNMFAAQVGKDIFVFDAGLMYPDSSLLGIDVVIPDLDFFKDYADQIRGIFLTHGHADAIGALPYILRDYDLPIYGSKLTIALAKITVQRENKRYKKHLFHEIDANSVLHFDQATLSFFSTTHSIPDSLGIDLSTSAGEIVYTGHFKFDPSSRPGYRTDMVRLAEISQKGVLALLCDTSNAEAVYSSASERDIETYVDNVFQSHEGRIIVAAKVSNVTRMQQIINAAARAKRKVVLTGRDVNKIVQTMIKLGYLKVPNGLLIHEKDLKEIPASQTVILETGRMGEPLQSLQQMANNRHRSIKIVKGDLVFIATTPSHAVETMVAQTSDMIYRAGGSVVQLGLEKHISGHATGRDLQLLITTLKPQFVFPVLGEYRSMDVLKHLAVDSGMNKKDIYLAANGEAYGYDKGRFYRTDPVPGEATMIDGSGVGDVGNIVLRDREVLSDDGIFIAVVTIDRRKKIIYPPKVTTRGFVYIKENKPLMTKAEETVVEAIKNNFNHKKFDWTELKSDIRHDLERMLYKETGRRPVVMPVVMEIDQNRHRAAVKRSQKKDDQESADVKQTETTETKEQ
ncbi:MAG: ribonuclease J [Lactobacillus sp.]|jgi:ribonuclease J|nr:ribonuclease J [Lactobacillus sp.]MCH4069312.1 ribonuclease J [Lactobacillus sp.]MCI1303701.1 ribonuclease J [Lactobacillus sp.]MCI1329790.1 ribonuclease J [Lactobacillus sp.]MCI1359916.1 ribonuclease J [Lactobacillus sp.]